MKIGRRKVVLSLAAFVCLCCGVQGVALGDGGVVLAEGGKAKAFILQTQPVQSAEVKQAVDDLKTYLGKISGAEFSSGSSLPTGYKGNVILVGRLTPQIIKKFGLESRNVPQVKGSVMITDGNELLLAGSDDFGVVMAVYNFLEDSLGVHWWTPWEESVPKMDTLKAPELDLIDAPSFPLGNEMDSHSLAYFGKWAFRNRLSNWRADEEAIENRLCPEALRSLDTILPMPIRKSNKNSTALIDGQRIPLSMGLCWTKPALQKYVANKELLQIAKNIAACKKEHIPAPLFYYLGPDSGCGWCQCDACESVRVLDESNAGPVLKFVNFVAADVAKKYPNLLIAMPAAGGTWAVPHVTKPADNVMVVWFNQNMRITRAMVDRLNTVAREDYEGWTKIAQTTGAFYYGDARGLGGGLGGAAGSGWPTPSVYAFDKNIKYFKRFNAKFFHLDCTPGVFSDMPDLKMWLSARLLLDANRSAETDLSTFLKGYYGPAGREVRKYLSELQRFAQVTPGSVSYGAELPDYSFLTTEFLQTAEDIWNSAAAAVKDDAVFSQRVAAGRLSVDRAALALWPELVRQWLLSKPGNTVENIPLNRNAILARYEQTLKQELARRTKEMASDAREGLEKTAAAELVAFRRNTYEQVKPAEPAFGAKPEQIFDYPVGGINFVIGDGVKLVEDKAAETGKAYCIPQNIALEDTETYFIPFKDRGKPVEPLKFDTAYQLPLIWGVQHTYGVRSLPAGKLTADLLKYNGAGYHWYKLGRVGLGSRTYAYLFESRALRVYFRQAGAFDLWVRMKVVAPDVTAEADATPAVYIDRVTLVRP